MRLGGLLKFSLIDYPGRMAAVLFTQGCNFRCPFCHNPELVLPDLLQDPMDLEEVFAFLEKRRGQLQGVVVTGGEPTIHADIIPFLSRLKSMEYLVKLDTNGSNPQVLKGIIEAHLADYFAMDIKSSPENYAKAAGTVVDMEQIRESIEVIKASGMLYEFRTTALKPFITQEDMAGIVRLIGAGQPYHLKKGIVTNKILDTRLADLPEYTDEEWEKIMGVLR
jgi:pyruvate formate lyase activating enzyme